VKKLFALALLASCGAGTAAVPPLGVSNVELPAASSAEAAPAPPLVLGRVDDCTDIPAWIPNDAPGPAVEEDLPYGTDGKEKYDISFPEHGKPKALVVIIHGGGWTSGGRKLFRPTIRMLATLGYAAASVSYRLASSDSRAFPASLVDVRCAIRAAEEKAGGGKTILLGASAGAHLAAMAALTRDDPALDGACADKRPLRVDGAVLFYGPLEIDRARERYVPIMRQAVDELLYGARRVACARHPSQFTCAGEDGPTVDEDAGDWMTRARAATPSRLVAKGAPPMLLLGGTEDTIAPLADAHDFAAALERAGVPHYVLEVPGQKHGFPVLSREAPLRAVSCTTLRFLSQIAAR